MLVLVLLTKRSKVLYEQICEIHASPCARSYAHSKALRRRHEMRCPCGPELCPLLTRLRLLARAGARRAFYIGGCGAKGVENDGNRASLRPVTGRSVELENGRSFSRPVGRFWVSGCLTSALRRLRIGLPGPRGAGSGGCRDRPRARPHGWHSPARRAAGSCCS